MENRHVPVLLGEVLDAFSSLKAGVVVDCTLGGAGHTAAILGKFPMLKVLGCDQDPAAIAAASEHLAEAAQQNRFEPFNANFSTLIDDGVAEQLPDSFKPPWAGVLLDLGYSSNQLEDPAYGMSFMKEGPLDMRLSRTGQTAWELLMECSDQELGDILKAYGEIIGAHKLARRIKAAIDDHEVLDSTLSLAGFLERIHGRRDRDSIHPATLVFQALRIAVNDELRALDHFLEGVILKMSESGRIAVITFHSLEDRLVKRWGIKHAAVLRPLTKKPVVAGAEEVKVNPRARSAKLRIYEKI